MIKSYVSGKAARVAFIVRCGLLYADVATPTNLYKAKLNELSQIFHGADDVEYLVTKSRAVAFAKAKLKRDVDRALALFDIATSPCPIKIKSAAAIAFDKICVETAEAVQIIENYLFSAENRSICDVVITDNLRENAKSFFRILISVVKSQDEIARIHSILSNTFSAENLVRQDAEHFVSLVIRQGHFKSLVMASGDSNKVDDAFGSIKAEFVDDPRYMGIIEAWRSRDIVYQRSSALRNLLKRNPEDITPFSPVRTHLQSKPQSSGVVAKAVNITTSALEVLKPQGIDILTERQKQVLRMIARHCQEKEIARELNINVPTVKDHAAVARRHLGVSSSRQAARILVDFETQAGLTSGLAYVPNMVAKPLDNEEGRGYEQNLPSAQRTNDPRVERSGTSLEDGGWSGESHMHHDYRDNQTDIGILGGGVARLKVWLKSMTLAKTLTAIVLIAMLLALLAVALLGTVTAMVQAIHNLNGATR